MANLDDLINFIEENPPPSERRRWWNKRDWKKQLSDSIAGWTDIAAQSFETSTEWQKMEKARSRSDYDDLCEVLVDVIGLRLAKRWCRSGSNDQERAAARWLSENLSLWNEFNQDMRTSAIETIVHRFQGMGFLEWINPFIWNDIENTTKSALLTTLFRMHPGEPFRSLEELRRSAELVAMHFRDAGRRLVFPSFPSLATCTGYVPAPEVDHVRNIMQEAGDDVWLARLDEMISRRGVACRNMAVEARRVPYVLNSNERELVARLLEITRASGYLPAALPPILASSETPPIFVAYPDLEADDADDDRHEQYEDREDRVPTNRERGRPETISIEELLGVYQPRHEQIVIYERGISWRRNRYDHDWLRTVVLIHEISHWIAHALPKPGSPSWPTDLFVLADVDVHEGWAQLMTWWIAKQVGGKFMATFNELNRNQSPPYHVFRQFDSERKESVMASLEKLRLLAWPARLQDLRDVMR